MKMLNLLVGAAAALLVANAASAATLTENFNAVPFGQWQSAWFGTQSNAQNYYVSYNGSSIDTRGNNPDGLWVSDGNGSGTPLTINFNGSFASTLTSFSLDIASHTFSTLTIFDKVGATLLSTVITNTAGAFTNPGVYAFYQTTSSNGIGGFSLSGSAQGNISIDNLTVTTGSGGVPEPATWAMMISGFGMAGAMIRRRKTVVA